MAELSGTTYPAAIRGPPPVMGAPQVTAPASDQSYWVTPNMCHPGTQAFKCPITLYIILIIIGAIINIWALFRAPKKDRSGKDITTGQLWLSFFIGMTFYIILAILFGWWIYERCRSCNTSSSGIIFISALLIPVLLALITGVIMGAVLNVGFIWTASKVPNTK